MLLVIDNYDSFTYNLVQYLGELGEKIEVRRNDQVTLDEIENTLKPERIVISPGPGTPDDAGISLRVIDRFAGCLCTAKRRRYAMMGERSLKAFRTTSLRVVTIRL
jgi:para-aminobenzoate synthetase component 2